MGKPIGILGVLGVCLVSPPALQAGLYSTVEPPPIIKPAFKVPHEVVHKISPKDFNQYVFRELLLVAQNPTSKPHQQYLKAKRELDKKPPDALTVEDRINLSYYLIRLGQPDEALAVLKTQKAQDSRHFMVFSNQATAHLMTADAGNFSERKPKLLAAWIALRQAQKYWPKKLAGWTPNQLKWLEKAEKAELDLIRGRMKDPPPKRGEPFTDVDHLFGAKFVKFLGKNGEYGPGPFPVKPTQEEVAIVQQLLTWLPQDVRLYWLLGELLNAQGEVGLAAHILDNLVFTRGVSKVPLLRDHWRILKAAAAKLSGNEGGPPISPEEKKDSGGWLPGREQLFLVGGIGVLVIALFGYLQFREFRRRRYRNSSSPGL